MDMPAEEIHQLGLSEVARIRGEMLAVKEQVGFKGDLDAFFKYVEEDPQFYFNSEGELLGAYRDVKRRIDALLPKLFADFPKADYEIRPVEPFRAASAAGGFVSVAVGRWQAPGNLLHQHLQPQGAAALRAGDVFRCTKRRPAIISRSRSSRSSPTCRASAVSTATSSYAEGWALYAESIGKELGVFTDPYQWYGRLCDEMLRAMRLVVDTGLHAKGWTPRAVDQIHARELIDGGERRRSPKSSATSSGPARRSATSSASCTSARCAPKRRRRSAQPSTCAISTARCCAMAPCPWTCSLQRSTGG